MRGIVRYGGEAPFGSSRMSLWHFRVVRQSAGAKLASTPGRNRREFQHFHKRGGIPPPVVPAPLMKNVGVPCYLKQRAMLLITDKSAS
jgi:hypothetical protein